MKLSLVIKPPDDVKLATAKQIGIDDFIDYNLHFPDEVEDHVSAMQKKVGAFGLRLTGMEGSPKHDDIIFGRSGRDQQIEIYKRYIAALAKAGGKVWCYNFNPSAMRVGRTTLEAPARGGAVTSAFSTKDWSEDPKLPETVSQEKLWENLEYFLKRIIPAAEEAGIKMAMHPDDPPISPMLGMPRLFINIENYDRLVNIVKSPANGLCFCVGCFTEMGVDAVAAIKKFATNINYMHLRNVRGKVGNFIEIFHDEYGLTDMVSALKMIQEIGYKGYARPDHVPLMAGEVGDGGGYSFQGRIFAIGYLRGVMHGLGMNDRD